MSTLVSLQTTDGRIINGINYTVDQSNIPSYIPTLAAAMPGGSAMGVYHLRTPQGWVYIPASQIAAVLGVKPGAQT